MIPYYSVIGKYLVAKILGGKNRRQRQDRSNSNREKDRGRQGLVLVTRDITRLRIDFDETF